MRSSIVNDEFPEMSNNHSRLLRNVGEIYILLCHNHKNVLLPLPCLHLTNRATIQIFLAFLNIIILCMSSDFTVISSFSHLSLITHCLNEYLMKTFIMKTLKLRRKSEFSHCVKTFKWESRARAKSSIKMSINTVLARYQLLFKVHSFNRTVNH